MKTKVLKIVLLTMIAARLLYTASFIVYASEPDNTEQVAITVEAEDENSVLYYAIDSDDPSAFSENSTFYVEPGSTHTVYVKDVAGNISSMEYTAKNGRISADSTASSNAVTSPDYGSNIYTNVYEGINSRTGEREVNIDVDLDNEHLRELAGVIDGYAPAEYGNGEVYEKDVVSANAEESDKGKIFYTVTTKEGEVFYIVVDQNNSENNVYLLDMVTVNDLQRLADTNNYHFAVQTSGGTSSSLADELNNKNSNDLLTAPTEAQVSAPAAEASQGSGLMDNFGGTIIIIILAAIGGGAYYYLKVHKKNKERQIDEIESANDIDSYEADVDEDVDDEDASDEWDIVDLDNGGFEEDPNNYIPMTDEDDMDRDQFEEEQEQTTVVSENKMVEEVAQTDESENGAEFETDESEDNEEG